ncbi:hypothetical protein FRC08_016507 [Ceratobasidium sp. 394]|nr:hypothetical protein FRC08_016507 [Ceratobasidium sp. 394]
MAPAPARGQPPSKTTTPRIPSVPLPEPISEPSQQRGARTTSQPSMPTSRRAPSPQRSRPQPPPVQPQTAVIGENKPVVNDRPRASEPPRLATESQAAQKAKYFESLAAGKRPPSPAKPRPAPVAPRQVLQPQETNTLQDRPEPSRPTPSQQPVQARPVPQSLPPSPAVANPLTPRGDNTPTFTAMPVPPTVPTARSLIPITSSGFEVPVVLPGNDARERADAALREAELFRLKREALGRVPMWLTPESIPQPPPPTRALRSSGNKLAAYSHWDLQHPAENEPTMAELLATVDKPVARAVYDPQLKHPRPRPVSSKSPAALLPDDAELLAKYDVRSARGGKGGQVATVASIWQNGAGNPIPESARPPKQYAAPAGPIPIANLVTPQADQAIPASPILGSSHTVVKSPSAPTMMYPATAVPVLSSTASLARPPGESAVRTRQMTFPASVPESQSDDTLTRRTSQPIQGIAVGQARLRELIGKYQS